jgi:hypothetical protein
VAAEEWAELALQKQLNQVALAAAEVGHSQLVVLELWGKVTQAEQVLVLVPLLTWQPGAVVGRVLLDKVELLVQNLAMVA